VTLLVNNTGNTNTTIVMNAMQIPYGWSVSLFPQGGDEQNATDLLRIEVPFEEGATVLMKVYVPPEESAGTWSIIVDVRSLNSDGSVYQVEEVVLTFIVG